MKIITLPGKSIRIVNNYVYFYSYYDEDLISLFKKLKFKWNNDYKAWYADLNDFANTKDFLSRISPLQSYFSPNEISYATHCIGHYFNKLPEIISFSRKETSDFPVPLPENLSLYPYQKAGVEFLVKKEMPSLLTVWGSEKLNMLATEFGHLTEE